MGIFITMKYIITEKQFNLIHETFNPPIIKKRLTKKIIEFWYQKFKNFIDGRIGELEEFESKYYDKVYYMGITPVFGTSGGQLYYNREFFQIFLTSLDEKIFNKVLAMWFSKKYNTEISWAGWSESLQKKGDPD